MNKLSIRYGREQLQNWLAWVLWRLRGDTWEYSIVSAIDIVHWVIVAESFAERPQRRSWSLMENIVSFCSRSVFNVLRYFRVLLVCCMSINFLGVLQSFSSLMHETKWSPTYPSTWHYVQVMALSHRYSMCQNSRPASTAVSLETRMKT